MGKTRHNLVERRPEITPSMFLGVMFEHVSSNFAILLRPTRRSEVWQTVVFLVFVVLPAVRTREHLSHHMLHIRVDTEGSWCAFLRRSHCRRQAVPFGATRGARHVLRQRRSGRSSDVARAMLGGRSSALRAWLA